MPSAASPPSKGDAWFRQRWLAEHPELARRIQRTQRELRGLDDPIGVGLEKRLEAVLERGLKSLPGKSRTSTSLRSASG
jgi:hypothetical protein